MGMGNSHHTCMLSSSFLALLKTLLNTLQRFSLQTQTSPFTSSFSLPTHMGAEVRLWNKATSVGREMQKEVEIF
jgi:hypothetical protein